MIVKQEKNWWKITQGVGYFLLLSLLSLITPLTIYLDLGVFKHGLGEISCTEVTQSVFLLVSIVLYLVMAVRQKGNRGFLLLVSGFFACMLIREQDMLLDQISHGAWLYPALLTAAATIGYVALRCRSSVLAPMAAYVGTKSYYHLVFGLVLILVFSRVFGSGNLIWARVFDGAYLYLYKTVIQEGLELLGYTWIMLSGWFLMRSTE